jgi:hypothetical protein
VQHTSGSVEASVERIVELDIKYTLVNVCRREFGVDYEECDDHMVTTKYPEYIIGDVLVSPYSRVLWGWLQNNPKGIGIRLNAICSDAEAEFCAFWGIVICMDWEWAMSFIEQHHETMKKRSEEKWELFERKHEAKRVVSDGG